MRIVQESSYEFGRTKYPFHTDAIVPSWFKKDLLLDVITWSKQTNMTNVGSLDLSSYTFVIDRAYLSKLEHTNTEINYQFKMFIRSKRSNPSVDAYLITLNKSVPMDSVPSDTIIISVIESTGLIGPFDSIELVDPTLEPIFGSSVQIFDLIYGMKFTSRHTDEVISMPNGIWENSPLEANPTVVPTTLMLEHGCSICPNDVLNEFIVKNNTTNADIIVQGDVKIKSGYNFEIAVDDEEVVDDDGVTDSARSILFSVYPGAGEGLAPCKHKNYVGIKSINGIKNTSENFIMSEGNCIGVKPIPTTNTLVILDKCEPCCKDCDESLGQIGSDVLDLGVDITALGVRITALGG